MPRSTILLTCVATFLGGAVAHAQAPAEAPVPETMPFDIPYGAPLPLEKAQKAAAAAVAEARKHNWKMAVAIVDPAGNLVHFDLMDGTQYASIRIAQAKATTAASFRRATKIFAHTINGGTPSTLSLLNLVGGVATEGSLPIVENGKLVGAIGVSGGMSNQDGVAAKAGLEAVAH